MQLALNIDSLLEKDQKLIDTLQDFGGKDSPTKCYTEDSINYFVNDYWTAKQRQSSRIHEISYRACFKAELPEFFIRRLTKVGDVVYDPFMGRGTTLIQAALSERYPIGNDINPLSRMLVEPRLAPPKISEVQKRLEEIPFNQDQELNNDLLAFYHPETLAEITSLKDYFIKRSNNGQLDSTDRWIRMVCLNRLTGHSPGFFSVYTLPPNQATSIKRQLKINKDREQIPQKKDIHAIILKKSRSLLQDYDYRIKKVKFLALTENAGSTPQIKDKSVDLIITSPPFLNIVQYSKDNWLRCWFAGIESEDIKISSHNSVNQWTKFVEECFTEFYRVLKPSGYIAFEVGEVRKGTVKLEKIVYEAIRGMPFTPIGVMINDQQFTKTANCWGVHNNSGGTNSNRIAIFRK